MNTEGSYMYDINCILLIKGGYGWGNFGDDALFAAVNKLAISACNDSEIFYYCASSKYLTKIANSNVNVIDDNSKRINCDIFLYGGGTQFFSFPFTRARQVSFWATVLKTFRMPHKIPIKIYNFFTKYLRQQDINYNHLSAIGVGIGPFVNGSLEQKETEDLFCKMGYIAVRDKASHRQCFSWNRRDAKLGADLCFWSKFKDEFLNSHKSSDNTIRKICIIVRDWPHNQKGDSYANNVLNVVEKLTEFDFKVKFILFCESDVIWKNRLSERDYEYLSWNPESDTIHSFVKQLNDFDLFISARYHGAVFATLLGKPVICIGIEQKLELFADLLQSGGKLWQYPFDVDECIKYIKELKNDYLKATHTLQYVTSKETQKADNMVSEFYTYFRNVL